MWINYWGDALTFLSYYMVGEIKEDLQETKSHLNTNRSFISFHTLAVFLYVMHILESHVLYLSLPIEKFK